MVELANKKLNYLRKQRKRPPVQLERDFAGVVGKLTASHNRLDMFAGLLTQPGREKLTHPDVNKQRFQRQSMMGMGLIGAFGASLFSLNELGHVVAGVNGHSGEIDIVAKKVDESDLKIKKLMKDVGSIEKLLTKVAWSLTDATYSNQIKELVYNITDIIHMYNEEMSDYFDALSNAVSWTVVTDGNRCQ